MKSLMEIWRRQADSTKMGMSVGVAIILAAIVALSLWIFRADYQVLFSDLAPKDAAAITTELEHMKVAYQLGENGSTILVPKEIVHKTRLKLMGKNLGLHGVVGFEIFNNVDFGMTEFVQKINYQRAIQGEITRTILALDEVQDARVHLAVPEQGLFKKTAAKPKASVTVTMKPGKSLSPDQINGIQRLVAASVPDIVAEDVTMLDQHGVALTRMASGEAETGSAMMSVDAQLDSKRSTEEYLTHKITQVLDRTLGAGQAIASVDVVLNRDQSRTTTEEVLPAKTSSQEGSPTGVIVRERQTMRDAHDVSAADASREGGSSGRNVPSNGITSVESEYQVGRRVEQIVTAAGAVQRMTISVVVKAPLNDAQINQIKEVVSLAVGFSVSRGDAIVVHSMDQFKSTGMSVTQPVDAVPSNGEVMARRVTGQEAGQETGQEMDRNITHSYARIVTKWRHELAGLFILSAIVGIMMYSWRRSKRKKLHQLVQARPINSADREQMLLQVRQWIDGHAPHEKIGRARS